MKSVIIVFSFFLMACNYNILNSQTPTGDYWKRYNQIYDIGKNYLDGTLRGEGKISLNSGSYNYVYNFKFPPGRNEIKPRVKLIYSSQTGRSFLGEGWSLIIPRIERSTKFGVPKYNNRDQFLYYDENGSVHKLIPVQETSSEIYYRFMSESVFSWFKYNKIKKSWTVLKKDGSKLLLGCTDDPRDKKFNWHLFREFDPVGNYVEYSYTYKGFREHLPTLIEYTKNENKVGEKGWGSSSYIEFNYSDNPNAGIVDCRAGDCDQEVYLLDEKQLEKLRIKVINKDGQIENRFFYYFNYEDIKNHKILSKIQPSNLPPITFSYFDNSTSFNQKNISYPDQQPPYWEHSESNYSEILNYNTLTFRTLMDMNGDGVKDLVSAINSYNDQKSQYKIYFGQINSENSSMAFQSPVIWDTPQRPPLYGGYKSNIRETRTGSQQITTKLRDLIDITGDGLPDYISIELNENMDEVLVVNKNLGAEFSADKEVWNFPNGMDFKGIFYESQETWPHYFTKVMLVDMNGDGLPDLVDCLPWKEDNRNFHVYLNDSKNFSQNPISWPSPKGMVNAQYRYRQPNADEFGWSLVELSDLNGDGLVDLVVQPDFNLGYPTNQPIKVYLNTGTGFTESHSENWNITGATSHSYLNQVSPNEITHRYGIKLLQDLNNDGLPDYIAFGGDGNWHYFQNLGNRFSDSPIQLSAFDNIKEFAEKSVTIGNPNNPTGSQNSYSQNKLMDINGDGSIDIVGTFLNHHEINQKYNFLSCYISNYSPGIKLKEIDNGYGAKIILEYAPSNYYTSHNSDSKIPFSLHLVKSSKIIDLALNENSLNTFNSLTYDYANAIYTNDKNNYFHPSNKEYRGFEEVHTMDIARNLRTELKFYQDDYKNGKLHQQAFYSTLPEFENLYPLLKNTIQYSTVELNLESLWEFPGVQFYYPERKINVIYNDPTGECTETKIEKKFDNYGNLLQETDYGILKKGNTAYLLDDKKDIYKYKSNINLEDNKYLFALKSQETYQADDSLKGQSYFYHDGLDDIFRINKGFLTKTINHYSQNEFITNTWEYEPNSGLLVSETNGNGNQTHYSYDTLTNTYITKQKKGNVIERFEEYDYLFGKNKKYIDPNGIIWIYTYDDIGRLVKERYHYYWLWRYGFVTTKENHYNDYSYLELKTPTYIEENVSVDAAPDGFDGANQENPIFAKKRSYFNGLGKKIIQIENHDGEKNIVRSFGYDAVGRLKFVSNPQFWEGWDLTNEDIEGLTSFPSGSEHFLLEYDPLNRVKSIVKPCGGEKEFSYGNDLGITMIDEEENKIKTVQDNRGNITEIINIGRGDKELRKSLFEYDIQGNIIKATDPCGFEIKYSRDWLGRINIVRLPNMEKDDGWKYNYDDDNNLLISESPAGRKVVNRYDYLNRPLVKKHFLNGQLEDSISFVYDDFINMAQNVFGDTVYHHYLNAQLVNAKNSYSIVDYDYDILGNIVKYYLKNKHTQRAYEISFIYYIGTNKLKSITYPYGYTYNYEYYPDGTLRRMIRAADNKIIAEATYTPFRQLESISSEFGHSYQFEYDDCGRPTIIISSFNNEIIMDRSIAYFGNDKIKSIHDKEEIGENGKPLQFSYDDNLMLEEVRGDPYKVRYRYYNNDDIHSIERGNVPNLSFEYYNGTFPWAVNKIKSSNKTKNITYDPDGFVKTIEEIESDESKKANFSFNTQGLIKSKNGNLYGRSDYHWLYDYDGNLINKHINDWKGTDYVDTYFEVNWSAGAEPNSTINYLYFGDLRIAAEVRKKPDHAELIFFHSDQQKNIRYITDTSGQILTYLRYFPFGKLYGGHSQGTSLVVKKSFQDKEYDPNLGIGVIFPKRIYQPESASWYSMDPLILLQPYSLLTNGINPYVFAGNDPINNIEIDGQLWGLFLVEIAKEIAVNVAFAEGYPSVREYFVGKSNLDQNVENLNSAVHTLYLEQDKLSSNDEQQDEALLGFAYKHAPKELKEKYDKTIEQTNKLLKNVRKLQKRLESPSGFKNYQDYKKAVRSLEKKGPVIYRRLEMKKEYYEKAMINYFRNLPPKVVH